MILIKSFAHMKGLHKGTPVPFKPSDLSMLKSCSSTHIITKKVSSAVTFSFTPQLLEGKIFHTAPLLNALLE